MLKKGTTMRVAFVALCLVCPLETGSGGAPPESPQGQSPPGMQSAPEGSSKTTVEPDKNK